MSWYIIVARKRRGPLGTAQLSEELQAGKVPPDAWVWTEGMDEWMPASAMPELRPRPAIQRVVAEPVNVPRATVTPPRATGPAKDAAKPIARSAPKASGNLLLRHWRGDLSLPVSYWVMSTAATLVVLLLGSIVSGLDITDAPRPVAIAVLALIGVAAIIVVWQIVGVWRSAHNYLARGGSRFWAQLALVLVAFAGLRFVIDMATVQVPIGREMLRIVDGDVEFSSYEVMLADDGTAILIDGPIGFGLTARVEHVLSSHDGIRAIHLNSTGGRLAEAYRLADRIRAESLQTYVAGECSSACVIAFATGAERLLGPEARIGLHEVAFRGVAPRWIETERLKYLEFLRGEGVDVGFVDTAMRRGGSGMWYPTHEQLIEAGIASAVEEAGEFSVTEIQADAS